MTWKNGRYLSKVKSGGIIATYEYDKNGLRTSKTYNGTRYDYAYAGDKLVWQGWEGNEMYFFYDNTGAPIAFWYFPDGGSRITGYYFTNQQGDVVRIEDPDGNVLASYSYDAWGKAYKSSGSMRNINPLRFRGYYYDTETGFYYLQSRYYDPVVSRFINADSYASTGQGFLGYNMFAYCGNDPVSRSDVSGDKFTKLENFGKKSVYGYANFNGYYSDDNGTYYSWGTYTKTTSSNVTFDVFSSETSRNKTKDESFGLNLGGIEGGIGAVGGEYKYGGWRLECVTGEVQASVSPEFVGIKVGGRLIRMSGNGKIPLPFTTKKLVINGDVDLFGFGFELYYDVEERKFKQGFTPIIGSGLSVSFVD